MALYLDANLPAKIWCSFVLESSAFGRIYQVGGGQNKQEIEYKFKI